MRENLTYGLVDEVRPMSCKLLRRRGFTLIELLIVISIIAILASILMPALSKARDKTRSIACANKLKQMGLAMGSYQLDYNEYFIPIRPRAQDMSSGYWPLFFMEQGYIAGRISFFTCPGNTGRVPGNDEVDGSYYSHYGYNYFHIGGSSRYGSTSDIPARLTELSNTSKTVIILDNKSPGELMESRYVANDSDDPSVSFGLAYPWHQRTVNVLWGDAHVAGVHALSSTEAYTTAVLGRKSNSLSKWKRNPE